MNEKKRDALEGALNECGQFLNLVVYEKVLGFAGIPLLEKKLKQGLLFFDDQGLGLDSADGTVVILGEGTQKTGMYFQFPSGYGQRINVLSAHLVETSRLRWAWLLENNLIELTEKAINFDSHFLKVAEMETVKHDVTGKEKEHKS